MFTHPTELNIFGLYPLPLQSVFGKKLFLFQIHLGEFTVITLQVLFVPTEYYVSIYIYKMYLLF